MNFTRALLNPQFRSVLTVPFKYMSASKVAGFSHLPEENAFVYKLPEGIAEVKYDKENGVLNLIHTNVPPSCQGKGIGKILAKNVLEYCLERNIKVKLTCEFLVEYCKKNKEFNKIIVPSY